jgi:hypothetical protein
MPFWRVGQSDTTVVRSRQSVVQFGAVVTLGRERLNPGEHPSDGASVVRTYRRLWRARRERASGHGTGARCTVGPAFEGTAVEWDRPRYSDTGLALDWVLSVLGGPHRSLAAEPAGVSAAAVRAALDAESTVRG